MSPRVPAGAPGHPMAKRQLEMLTPLLASIGAGNVSDGGGGVDIGPSCATGVPCGSPTVLDPRETQAIGRAGGRGGCGNHCRARAHRTRTTPAARTRSRRARFPHLRATGTSCRTTPPRTPSSARTRGSCRCARMSICIHMFGHVHMSGCTARVDIHSRVRAYTYENAPAGARGGDGRLGRRHRGPTRASAARRARATAAAAAQRARRRVAARRGRRRGDRGRGGRRGCGGRRVGRAVAAAACGSHALREARGRPERVHRGRRRRRQQHEGRLQLRRPHAAGSCRGRVSQGQAAVEGV